MNIKKLNTVQIVLSVVVMCFVAAFSAIAYGDNHWMKRSEAMQAALIDEFNEDAARQALGLELDGIREEHRKDNCKLAIADIMPQLERYDMLAREIGGVDYLLPSQLSDLDWLNRELTKHRVCAPPGGAEL